jgi:4'-phosphopantetheinyl transferase
MPIDWSPAPEALRLEPGCTHLFRLDLDLPAERLDRLAGLLSPDEKERAARYLPEAVRRRFTAARGQLRQVLGLALGQPPDSIRFAQNEYGKPLLAGGGLQFNVSHSQGFGLLALNPGSAVGVDVEAERDMTDLEGIARRFYASAEVQALFALPTGAQRGAFFSIWTRKEALIKATGKGLSFPLDGFAVPLGPAWGVPLAVDGRTWRLYAVDAAAGYAAALVVEGEGGAVRGWDWPAPTG